jgi:hypothetical protein
MAGPDARRVTVAVTGQLALVGGSGSTLITHRVSLLTATEVGTNTPRRWAAGGTGPPPAR